MSVITRRNGDNGKNIRRGECIRQVASANGVKVSPLILTLLLAGVVLVLVPGAARAQIAGMDAATKSGATSTSGTATPNAAGKGTTPTGTKPAGTKPIVSGGNKGAGKTGTTTTTAAPETAATATATTTTATPTTAVATATTATATATDTLATGGSPRNAWIAGVVGLLLLVGVGFFGIRWAMSRGITIPGLMKKAGVEMPQDAEESPVAHLKPGRTAPVEEPLPSLADQPIPRPVSTASGVVAAQRLGQMEDDPGTVGTTRHPVGAVVYNQVPATEPVAQPDSGIPSDTVRHSILPSLSSVGMAPMAGGGITPSEPLPVGAGDGVGVGTDAAPPVAGVKRMGPRLVGLAGAVASQTYPIEGDTEGFSIGREPGNSLVLNADGTVSRRHAAIEPRGSGWAIMDKGSSNGTFVNGARVEGKSLHSGDEIQIGTSRFRYED